MDKIREEIARIIKTPHRILDDCVTEILSIKGIRIEAENQELPCIHETGNYVEDLELLHQEYKREGWVRCLKKEEQ
jgi:hypothetical protein